MSASSGSEGTGSSRVEPLHPTHDIADFTCSADDVLYTRELEVHYGFTHFVVGHRVLASVVGSNVTGYLSLIDLEFDVPGDAEKERGLFVANMAVSDHRQGSTDAPMLLQQAIRCIDPTERATGRDYWGPVVQPRENARLLDAAKRLGFRPLGDGLWGSQDAALNR